MTADYIDWPSTLEKAADKLSQPDAWCRGAEARDERGYSVYFASKAATSWCAIGALRASNVLIHAIPYFVVQAVLGQAGNLVQFNDVYVKNANEVVTAFRKAAAFLREKETHE